ncbi:MAG: Rid family hydrolase [Pseudomonadota bacterium]
MRKEIVDGTEVIDSYARAVRKRGHIHVSGTTSMDADGHVVGSDLYEQSLESYRKVLDVLASAGGSVSDVVRVVVYVTDISAPEGFMRAHRETFATVRPAATLVEVSGLVDAAMLVEIEAYAIVDDD